MPQLPFSHFRLHFREGGRSPLITPPGCGSFEASTRTLYPSSGGRKGTVGLGLSDRLGPRRLRLPERPRPFPPALKRAPKPTPPGPSRRLRCGSPAQTANRTSPRSRRSCRPGCGNPRRAPHCSEAVDRAGDVAHRPPRRAEELSAPLLPCRLAGRSHRRRRRGGSQLTYVSGGLYLAGPYRATRCRSSRSPRRRRPVRRRHGRRALRADAQPGTGEVEVDGSRSDPIPHILKGIPLDLRDLRAFVDSPISPSTRRAATSRAHGRRSGAAAR